MLLVCCMGLSAITISSCSKDDGNSNVPYTPPGNNNNTGVNLNGTFWYYADYEDSEGKGDISYIYITFNSKTTASVLAESYRYGDLNYSREYSATYTLNNKNIKLVVDRETWSGTINSDGDIMTLDIDGDIAVFYKE